MSQQKTIYENSWKKTFDTYHIPKLITVQKLMIKIPNELTLDLGCGDGIITEKMKNNSNIVVGIDISENNIRLAQTRVEHLVLADIEKGLPFRNNISNLCLSLDTIEHTQNTDNFLIEINRVLKKKGHLIITTPNLTSFVERMLFLLGFQPQNLEVSSVKKFGSYRQTPPVGHFKAFTLSALTEMLEHYDYKIIKTETTTYYLGFMKYLDLIIGRIKKTWGSLLIVVAQHPGRK